MTKIPKEPTEGVIDHGKCYKWAIMRQKWPPGPPNPFFILEKYGNPYQNPTASIKSYSELGSQVPPQFPGLDGTLSELSVIHIFNNLHDHKFLGALVFLANHLCKIYKSDFLESFCLFGSF